MSEADSSAPSALMCVRHARIPATFACDKCGAGMCNMCGFGKPAGSRYCANCVAAMMPAAPVEAAASSPAPASGITPPPLRPPPLPPRPAYTPQPTSWKQLRVPPGKFCALHPTVGAIDYCSNCGAFMCEVCSFDVPGMAHHHVCPTCAVSPPSKLSGKRKLLMIFGYVLAVWSTIGLVVIVSGMLASMVTDRESLSRLGLMIIFFIFIPSLLGLAVSFSAQEKNLPNPPSVWGGIIWNSLLVTCFAARLIINHLS